MPEQPSPPDQPPQLTPTQARVRAELLDIGGARPEFDRHLAGRLRDELESKAVAALAGANAPGSPGGPPWTRDSGRPVLTVSKRNLTQVHQCERLLLTQQAQRFTWTAATACGAVAHKAIELSTHVRARFPPSQLVALAIGRLIDDEQGPAGWLQTASESEQAELRSRAVDAVTKFDDSFPPIPVAWRPRVESRLKTYLADGRVELAGKVDLALGQARATPTGAEARTLIVDLKTGGHGPNYAADLRFYALLETLRVGVPPFRLASFYLDSGDWVHEEVDEDLLWATVRRTTDGLERLSALLLTGNGPTETPGPQCRWCPANVDCETGQGWLAAEQHEAPASGETSPPLRPFWGENNTL
ncbi:MAG TPA: PD-(D/E)XK nuclease family protein [Acidimicrobiales bacterium]|nr:PD-(D/E)XK nuclease family protein [Acidimicrobiales bacterium]